MDIQQPDSVGASFWSSVNLEEAHCDEGFKEGYGKGLASGKQEGYEVGLMVEFETGEELGFYKGCIYVWNSAIRVDPDCFSGRAPKSIKTMDELVRKYPVMDPENETVSEIMESRRLKFRSISATLKVKLEYNGYPKTSNASIEI